MAEAQIRFDDGAAYEQMMGKWSQLAGAVFLDWLAPPSGQCWLDVGCGNGAFTELLALRCDPAGIHAIDPSEAQLAYARTRPAARTAQFRQGDAMALPYADDSFDAAVMALVIFFVPDPVQGIAEMVRVVRPGGTISAYAWDLLDGGFPLHALATEMRAMGVPPPLPPSVDAAALDALRNLWMRTGIGVVETRQITVQRTFTDFADYWAINSKSSSMGPKIAALSPGDVELLKSRVRARLQVDAAGRVTCSARANAVKGRLPARG